MILIGPDTIGPGPLLITLDPHFNPWLEEPTVQLRERVTDRAGDNKNDLTVGETQQK